jgi:hypothetical protein
VLEIGKRDNVTFMTFLKKFASDDKEVSDYVTSVTFFFFFFFCGLLISQNGY